MRLLSKLSYHCRQSGLVQRFARQTEHRRNIGTEGGASTANTAGNWGGGRKTKAGSYSNKTDGKGGVNDPNFTAEFPQIEVLFRIFLQVHKNLRSTQFNAQF
jgi:hypothetical protein